MLEISEAEWYTLAALANALIPELQAHGKLFKREFERVFGYATPESQKKVRLALWALSFRASAFPLTRSRKLVTEMTSKELVLFLQSLIRSPIPLLQMFVSGVQMAALLVLCRINQPFRQRIAGDAQIHPYLEQLRNSNTELFVIPDVYLPRSLVPTQPRTLRTEIAIIGSGCSAMVAAYMLSAKGYRVLLIEKGYHINSLTSPVDDYVRDKESFESEGAVISSDSSMIILAGSTVGGGGAVNWSCSLRPNERVRNEWVSRGMPFAGEPIFEQALDFVEDVMKVKYLKKHSFTNNVILGASAKLGYPASETGQNTGEHAPNSAFVDFGHRRGPKGGVAEWLRAAVDNGAQILTSAEVVNIRHHYRHATGLDVVFHQNGKQIPVQIDCKHVICAGGSIQTPNLLQRSQFRNRNIGHGLKLHPVTVAFGEFNEQVNKRDDPIMTAVSSVSNNLDGEGHGPNIEAIHHRPHLFMHFTPWHDPSSWQSKVNSYERTSALLVITRDKGHGTVSFNKSRPHLPTVEYATSAYDLAALKQGCITAANMLYIQGAKRIYVGNVLVPDFVPTMPVDQRSIWDTDFREWIKRLDSTVFNQYETKLGSAHQMASCRMGSSDAHGAVDTHGRLYECPNVHVIDTSVFPSASGSNPMISCMAVAYCLTKYMLQDLERESKL